MYADAAKTNVSKIAYDAAGIRAKKKFNRSLLLLIPPLVFLLIFLVIPMIVVVSMSFKTDTTLSFFAEGNFTLNNYLKFFRESVYSKVMLLTFKISLFTTFFCLLLGYPVAYAMTKCSRRIRSIIMIAVMVPFWTSTLVRTYSWMILLQTDGIINNILISAGLIDKPLQLFKNTTGVYIGMTHILLPYMILSLYPVMAGIDKNYLSAAQNLGANKFLAFVRVYFPLSLQGIAAGCILVFTMGIGYFITPSLLGGTNDTMISQMIQIQVSKLLNWPFASSAAVILLVISLGILYALKKIMKVDKLW